MRICVINFSGNVGKTTLATHLLQPRMPKAQLFSVESLNVDADGDGVDVQRIRGKRFADLQAEMLTRDHAIVDVGASNVEDFVQLMQQFEGSQEDYDCFLVPTVSDRKQQSDTINTLDALDTLGVPASRVRVVFNNVAVDEEVEDQFGPVFGFAAARELPLNPGAVVYANEVFERLKGGGRTLHDVLSDPVDYRVQLRAAKSDEAKALYVDRIAVRRLAGTCVKNLDATYAELFG